MRLLEPPRHLAPTILLSNATSLEPDASVDTMAVSTKGANKADNTSEHHYTHNDAASHGNATMHTTQWSECKVIDWAMFMHELRNVADVSRSVAVCFDNDKATILRPSR